MIKKITLHQTTYKIWLVTAYDEEGMVIRQIGWASLENALKTMSLWTEDAQVEKKSLIS